MEAIKLIKEYIRMCSLYSCSDCPINSDARHFSTCHDFLVCDVEHAVPIIEKWSEEHPPEVDWSKVEVDTPILVKDSEVNFWHKRHFASYKNGQVYTWYNGATSWSGGGGTSCWAYAKLAEETEK